MPMTGERERERKAICVLTHLKHAIPPLTRASHPPRRRSERVCVDLSTGQHHANKFKIKKSLYNHCSIYIILTLQRIQASPPKPKTHSPCPPRELCVCACSHRPVASLVLAGTHTWELERRRPVHTKERRRSIISDVVMHTQGSGDNSHPTRGRNKEAAVGHVSI